jgi:threonylcarbamoyladenosine tRNA methylthiotransferase MtaB
MLVERDGRSGHGENFAGLMLDADAVPGSIVPVRIGGRDGDRLTAELAA